mmetsp:Transcript_74735/g.151788  ORF Transcript_74735/g.151788 Transcript_74735/m.151788 type:complete len:209 (+) Transcript_74735:156-782(+)
MQQKTEISIRLTSIGDDSLVSLGTRIYYEVGKTFKNKYWENRAYFALYVGFKISREASKFSILVIVTLQRHWVFFRCWMVVGNSNKQYATEKRNSEQSLHKRATTMPCCARHAFRLRREFSFVARVCHFLVYGIFGKTQTKRYQQKICDSCDQKIPAVLLDRSINTEADCLGVRLVEYVSGDDINFVALVSDHERCKGRDLKQCRQNR